MKGENKNEISLMPPITPGFVERRIYMIRGIKVMLDFDLAELYQVPTMRLNEQVKRNIDRFPGDFMFRLSAEETKKLNLSQFAIGSQKHRNPNFSPFAFTELGVSMLSSVLRSERAVQMNIYIMRAFVKLREILSTNEKIAKKIKDLEEIQKEHTGHLIAISSTLKRLMHEEPNKKGHFGFIPKNDE